MWNTKIDKIAYSIIIVFVLFLIIFGWIFHNIEVANMATPERDGYVYRAIQIQQGILPRSRFQPLFYSIVSAGIGTVAKDVFTGARLTSTLFAGLFILITYFLAKNCFNEETALFAVLAMVLNYQVIIHGLFAASDITFSALIILTLYLLTQTNSHLKSTSVLLIALTFALSFFTRYVGISILPIIIIALFYTPSISSKRKFLYLTIFFLASLVFLSPHFFLTHKAFGNPLYNDTWRNLAGKLYGKPNWDKTLGSFNELIYFIIRSPKTLFLSGLQQIWILLNRGLIRVSGYGITGYMFTALFLAGLYNVMLSLNRKRILLLSFLFIYIIFVAFTFYTTRLRFLLPILPLLYIIIGNFIIKAFPGYINFKNLALRKYIPFAIIFLTITGYCSAKQIPHFINKHPHKELAAAIMLQNKYGSNIKVLGTYPFIIRHVKYKFRYFADAYDDEIISKEKYYNKLERIINNEQANYIIIGRLSIRNRPKDLLMAVNTPPFLECISHNNDVAVYKVRR